MATTTNYGWTTPDDTALVKDGASAIRTLGTSVDTTTKALNPSTTLGDIEYRSSTSNTNTRVGIGSSGQGLQVVAGVPSWAASSTSTLTTTGDLLYASAANTLARRAIGSTGNVLTVAGGVPTWAAPAGGGKVLQVVYASTKTPTYISTGTLTDTGLTATITPTLNTSKILVLVSQHLKFYNSSGGFYWNGSWDLYRNSTSILTNDNDVLQIIAGTYSTGTLNMNSFVNMNYLDSPATTSATTYKTKAAKSTGTELTCNGAGYSTITLLEIGA